MKLPRGSVVYYYNAIKKLMASFVYNVFFYRTALPAFSEKEDLLLIKNHQSDRIAEIPAIIWMYWEEADVPAIVKRSVENVCMLHPDYTVVLLNRETIQKYLPGFAVSAYMPIANKTDLIRLELLYKYGGIWIDATIILNGSLNWVHLVHAEHQTDVIGYYRHNNTVDFNFPVIESWFLAASLGNRFIKAWLDILNPLREIGSETFFRNMEARPDYSTIKQKIDRPDYLLVYLACQIAMREHREFNFYLKKCEDSVFYIQEYFAWDPRRINYALCRLKRPENRFPVLKLTSGDRIDLEIFADFGLIRETSIVGDFLAKSRVKECYAN